MSREVQLVVRCDVCGALAPEIAFRLQVEGVKYVIDLCERDQEKLLAAIRRYVPEPPAAVAGAEPAPDVPKPGRGRRRGAPVNAKVPCPEPSCGMALGKNNLPRHLRSAHGMDPASVEATLAKVTWPE